VRDEFIRGVLDLSEEASWTVFVLSNDIDAAELRRVFADATQILANFNRFDICLNFI
jgi:hypothetical protein